VVAVWAFLVCLTALPYVRAWAYPPPGQVFLGAFYALPDFYNYLTYVQQSEDGRLPFVNKLTVEPHRAAYVNVEWWLVGRLSAALGRRPTLAYRLFGAVVAFALVAAADRWLRSGGLPASHRFAALLLVFTGGGLGGVLFEVMGPPAWRFLDLTTGLYPVVSLFVNPHFVTGSALLLWALWFLTEVPGRRGIAAGLVLGTLLGLARPYDVVLLVAIRVLVVAARERPARYVGALAPLLGLGPVAAYNYWVFYRYPPFRVLSAYTYSFPQVGSVLLAMAPVLVLLGVLALRRRGRGIGTSPVFAAWGMAGFGFLLQPFSYSLQFLVDWGLPLLALAALGLARYRPAVTLAAAGLFSTTGIIALNILLGDHYWFVPAWKLEAMPVIAGRCRPDAVALVPEDLGLLVDAYTPCKAYVAHPVMRDYARRVAEAERFYAPADPAWRRELLDRECVSLVLLPGVVEERPGPSLGGAPYTRVAAFAAEGGVAGLYARDAGATCPSWHGSGDRASMAP
jgi:hypothetical protein